MFLCKLTNRIVCCLFCLCISLSIQAQQTDRALFPVQHGDRWGYIDRSGKIVIEPQFERAEEFSEGLAAIELDGKWGFIDTNGKLIVEPQYSSAQRFSEGLARIQIGADLDGKWGFIDHTGQTVIAPQFTINFGSNDESFNFHEGLAVIETGDLKAFIDKTGTIVIRPRFQFAYPFSEGLASVKDNLEGKWGFIDKTGAWIIPPRYDWSSSFSEGLAPVSTNGTCGYVDKTGQLTLIPPFKAKENDCAAVWGSFDNGISRWMVGDKYGYINTRGELVIQPEFDLTFNFSEGLAFVEKDHKYGFIDQTGKLAIEPQFYFAKDFHNGLAKVGLTQWIWGYVDKTGQIVWQQTAPTAADEEVSRFLQPGHYQAVQAVGWSSDNNVLTSYSSVDGLVQVWNVKTGQLLWGFKDALLRPDTPLKSPDGTFIATGIKRGACEIREAQSGKIIWTRNINWVTPERVTSPDGSMIAERGGYGDPYVKIFDAHTRQLIRRLEGHPGIIHSLAFTPDGKLVASAGGDNVIRFWNAQSGAVEQALFGHTLKITAIAFSGDGKQLVSGSQDDTIKVWNVADGSLIRSFPAHGSFPEGVTSVTLSRDGQTIIGAVREEIRLWETATGKQIGLLTSGETEVRSLMFSPDDRLIVAGYEDSTIKLWDVKNTRLLRVIKGQYKDLSAAVISPDGKLIAAGYESSDCRVELWSVLTGRLVNQLGVDSDYVTSISFGRNGTMIATGHFWGDVKLWNAQTGKLVNSFKQPFSENDRVAFSPDGKSVVSGGWNQNVLLWNVQRGKVTWSALPLDWETDKRLFIQKRKD